MIQNPFDYQAQRSLQRILPRVEQTLKKFIAKDPQGWEQFTARLNKNFATLFEVISMCPKLLR